MAVNQTLLEVKYIPGSATLAPVVFLHEGLGSVAMQLHDWTLARDCFGKVVAIDSTYRRQFNSVYARARDKAEKEALQEAAP